MRQLIIPSDLQQIAQRQESELLALNSSDEYPA